MDNWETFRNNIYDRLFEGDVRTAFPQMDFNLESGKWVSSHHLDGERDTQGKKITYIYSDSRFCAQDKARGENVELIELFANLNGLDREGAEERLSDLCRVPLPNGGGSDLDKFKAEQSSRAAANNAFQAAIWNGSDEAQQALEYLRKRWNCDDDIIKASGVGIITDEAQKALEGSAKNECYYFGSGRKARITIPFLAGSRLLGFKFRKLLADDPDANKYINSKGLRKGNQLFGIVDGVAEIVVFEAELDTLHAKALGLSNATATAGGAVSEAQAKDAIRRGVRKFVLLLDNDEAGYKYIERSYSTIEDAGGKVFVASIPTNYKDADEYLVEHSIDELRRAISKAQPALLYLYRGELADSELESFPEYLDRREQEKARAEAAKNAADRIRQLADEGRYNELADLMTKTASELRVESEAEEFNRVYSPPSGDTYDSLLSNLNKGLPTSYSFKDIGGRAYPLTLEAGITFVCASTGHGKTSFLNCLALDEARRNIALNNGKRVLYFTYEIDKGLLLLDLINTFNNNPDISNYPLESIRSYFEGKRDEYFAKHSGSKYNEFVENAQLFKAKYITSGALTIIEENYTVEKLLRSLRYATARNDVSLICIDYAQLIYSEDFARMRTEEIKRIVHYINEFTKQNKLPVVMAAQFNRTVNSPLDVSLNAIGEGGDFERIANTVVGLFNLSNLKPTGSKTDDDRIISLLSRHYVQCTDAGGNIQAVPNKVYAVVLKRRYGVRGVEAVFDWEGKTKYIKPNNKEATNVEAKEQALFNDIDDEEDVF